MVKILEAQDGIVAAGASDRQLALWYLDVETPDAVVLSLGPTPTWEQELCKEIRERTIAPVLVVGERGQQLALARSLDAGGDADLMKPFTAGTFLSHLFALLRRVGLASAGHAGQFNIGTLAINVYRRDVRVEGRSAELTPTEFEILRCLLNNAGRALSYRSLATQVQGYDCPTDEARRLLKVHIHNLRKKIEPVPQEPAHILNARGFGYLFERRRSARQNLNQLIS